MNHEVVAVPCRTHSARTLPASSDSSHEALSPCVPPRERCRYPLPGSVIRRAERIGGEMRVPRRGLGLSMAKQRADDDQRLTTGCSYGGVAVAEVMDADI